jgi:hypothetical protein
MRSDARKLELDDKKKAAADLNKKADDEEHEWDSSYGSNCAWSKCETVWSTACGKVANSVFFYKWTIEEGFKLWCERATSEHQGYELWCERAVSEH